MSLREDFLQSHPDFPLLDVNQPAAVRNFLRDRGWLGDDEEVLRCEKAGEGNMNLTMRVVTSRQSIIVKQARPWVEKYDHIPAPWNRMTYEQRFYERTASIPEVARRMPGLIAADTEASTLVLEDLSGASDMTDLYRNGEIDGSEATSLGRYVHALHGKTRGKANTDFANRDMRALNHEHIFQVPLDPDNGLDLEGFEPGLAETAAKLQTDSTYTRIVGKMGQRYLADGPCLVHGDYFPGSWLRTDDGVRVIDPEFCFCGDPEFDLGVALAHLALAQQASDRSHLFIDTASGSGSGPPPDGALIARYAGIEIMRRLIGVAQLPLPPTTGFRAEMLERSRRAVVEGSPEALWA